MPDLQGWFLSQFEIVAPPGWLLQNKWHQTISPTPSNPNNMFDSPGKIPSNDKELTLNQDDSCTVSRLRALVGSLEKPINLTLLVRLHSKMLSYPAPAKRLPASIKFPLIEENQDVALRDCVHAPDSCRHPNFE